MGTEISRALLPVFSPYGGFHLHKQISQVSSAPFASSFYYGFILDPDIGPGPGRASVFCDHFVFDIGYFCFSEVWFFAPGSHYHFLLSCVPSRDHQQAKMYASCLESSMNRNAEEVSAKITEEWGFVCTGIWKKENTFVDDFLGENKGPTAFTEKEADALFDDLVTAGKGWACG